MVVSQSGETPIAGWFMVENPVEMDDDWGYPISGNHYVSPLQVCRIKQSAKPALLLTPCTHSYVRPDSRA